MRQIAAPSGIIILLSIIFSFTTKEEVKGQFIYKVKKLTRSINIYDNWDKPQWQNIGAVNIKNYMGELFSFYPSV